MENGEENTCVYSENGDTPASNAYHLFLVKKEFDNGDIVKLYDGTIGILYMGSYYHCSFCLDNRYLWFEDNNCNRIIRLATEEEKKMLFSVLEKNGKRWNPETKQIEDVCECTLHTFDKILGRDDNGSMWQCDLFEMFWGLHEYKYRCVCRAYKQCIPYNEETKNLLGTIADCPEKYKTW
jgi:hypothetical protein